MQHRRDQRAHKYRDAIEKLECQQVAIESIKNEIKFINEESIFLQQQKEINGIKNTATFNKLFSSDDKNKNMLSQRRKESPRLASTPTPEGDDVLHACYEK